MANPVGRHQTNEAWQSKHQVSPHQNNCSPLSWFSLNTLFTLLSSYQRGWRPLQHRKQDWSLSSSLSSIPPLQREREGAAWNQKRRLCLESSGRSFWLVDCLRPPPSWEREWVGERRSGWKPIITHSQTQACYNSTHAHTPQGDSYQLTSHNTLYTPQIPNPGVVNYQRRRVLVPGGRGAGGVAAGRRTMEASGGGILTWIPLTWDSGLVGHC